MNRANPILLSALLIMVSSCGSLEWPPNSSHIDYSVNQESSVNTIEENYKYGSKLGPRENLKKTTNSNPMEHIVTAGETLWRIAQGYNIDIYELAILNQIEPPFRIFVGQSLILSNTHGKPIKLAAFKKLQPTSSETILSPNNSKNDLYGNKLPDKAYIDNQLPPLAVRPGEKPRNNTNITFSQTSRNSSRKKKRGMVNEIGKSLPPVKRGSLFIWPVKGKIISSFGAKANGLHNDGVNILAPRGTVVRAAHSGVVAYTGNELRGFGNLLLIKHSNGWVTAYAHNQRVTVSKGEKVKRGQAIAHVGSSGHVFRPQLHFEIRKGNRALDPIRSISDKKIRRTKVKTVSSKG